MESIESGSATPETSSGSESVNETVASTDNVSYETHRRLLSQRKKDQETLAELRAFKDQVELEKSESEQVDLAKKGEYDKALDIYKQRALTAEKNAADKEMQLVTGTKCSAFLDALPGRLRNNAYLSHVDLEGIVIDPSSGVIDDVSVKEVVDKFVKEHGGLIESNKDIPKLPQDAPKHLDLNPQTNKRASVNDHLKNFADLMHARELQKKQL